MRRRWLRKGIRLGLLTAVVAAVAVTVRRRRDGGAGSSDGAWKSSPLSMPISPGGPGEADAQPRKPEPALVEPTMMQNLSERSHRLADGGADGGAAGGSATVTDTGLVPEPRPSGNGAAGAGDADGGPEAGGTAEAAATAASEAAEAAAAEARDVADAALRKAREVAAEARGAAGAAAAKAAEAAERAASPTKRSARKAGKRAAAPAWTEPDGDHCPRSHQVKANLRSGIYHLVGMRDYGRTTPDRCYRDEEAAAADGLRKAKR